MLKTFYIKTFGCQMNYADSEKINMILMSAGLRKVVDPVKADVIILNTCSVRQKGEDRVFGFMNEVARFHRTKKTDTHTDTQRKVLFGITGCMVRKSGMAKRYLGASFGKEVPTRNEEAEDFQKQEISRPSGTLFQKRVSAKKITLLDSPDSLANYDDELFLRSPLIDFTFRIEEVAFLTKILSLITGEDIGNDAKYNEYLAVKQLQENPATANIIIQTGCDNFCSFCIVPHTRGRETSRGQDAIVREVQEVVQNGTKEVTLLGQNVNSYGKETRAKLWNSEEMKWVSGAFLLGDADREGGEECSSPGEESRSHLGVASGDSPLGGVPTKEAGCVFPRKYEQELLAGPTWGKDSLFPYWTLPRNKNLEEHAKKLRKAGILSEVRFWQYFKDKKILGFDIDRQVIIGDYIVDFFIREVGLVFEVDGSSHDQKQEYDAKRENFLNSLGLQVLHFSGYEVLKNPEGVYEKVIQIYNERLTELQGNHPVSPTAIHPSRGETRQTSRGETIQKTFTTPFRELLEEINAVEGLDRIRFTSSNPHDMTRDILDAHFDLDKMCQYLHFALQSGSDSMLHRMNRKHTYADFKAQVDYLRSRNPLFALSTDIIVGFPGETEEEFEATATAMRECQFDFAFIARYSPRLGTVATTRYEDDISASEKARRWSILNDILRESVRARNLLMVGREEEILISGEWKDDMLIGRTRNWKEVYIKKDIGIEKSSTKKLQIGDIVRVHITKLDGWVLRGEVL